MRVCVIAHNSAMLLDDQMTVTADANAILRLSRLPHAAVRSVVHIQLAIGPVTDATTPAIALLDCAG